VRQARAGFTLVEILVGLVVLEAGLVGAAGMLVLAGRTLNRARDLEWAVLEVRAVADSLVRAGAEASGERATDFGSVLWSVAPGANMTEVQVVAESLAGDLLVNATVLVPGPLDSEP
jgi:Tfp pilus assembly protein PilV